MFTHEKLTADNDSIENFRPLLTAEQTYALLLEAMRLNASVVALLSTSACMAVVVKHPPHRSSADERFPLSPQ